ncbi:carbohydrate ABC transporter permease [Paenibacillus harenae]|uniref:Multiple sugar transport system permease protein n=1 Tax=Paenibacillus harenae TaxID=306543 RepID=A0ABT9TZ21_PAEHA|nr:sugar ABC transporter permease [Paenibacillus harenae]MDQ0112620.1 multiple sugar transport system permease protein [Paenibacillus harenae]
MHGYDEGHEGECKPWKGGNHLIRIRQQYRRDAPFTLLFLAPSLAGFLLFFIIPFGAVVYYSVIDNPVNGNFAGLSNYEALWDSGSFRKAFFNSLLFAGVSVPLLFAVSLGLSLLLRAKLPFRQSMRTMFLLPLVVPVASVILVWQTLFQWNGAINGLFLAWGMNPVDWMNSNWAFAVMLAVFVWKNAGYNLIVFLAGLSNIPTEQYESASMDGAGPIRAFMHITWPGLAPTSFFVVVMSIVQSFKVFRETYLVAGAYPNDSIYTLQHFMNNMFASLDYPKLTAAAVLLSIVIGVTVYVLFRAERRSREALQ